MKNVINELNEILEEEDWSYEQKEWFKELLEVAEQEDFIEYEYKAFRDYSSPNGINNENIPVYKKTPIALEVIFDAFEEICRRLKEEK
jgi:hypothetical protein